MPSGKSDWLYRRMPKPIEDWLSLCWFGRTPQQKVFGLGLLVITYQALESEPRELLVSDRNGPAQGPNSAC